MNIGVIDSRSALDLVAAELAPNGGHPGIDSGSQALRFALLRHAASRLCPCSRRTLLTTAVAALVGIMGTETELAELLDDDLEALEGSGDLILARDGSSSTTVVYLSPPMFVRRSNSTVYLVGGFAEAAWPLANQALAHGPYRRLTPAPSDDELRDSGIHPFPPDAWLERPAARPARDLLGALDVCLEHAGPAGELGDLQVLDPRQRDDYYVGRFVAAGRRTGRFVARRRLRWGSRTWSYIELIDGEAQRFVDFPQVDQRFRACDEAWWTICAQDAVLGRGQRVSVGRDGPEVTIAFFMPIPRWAERRLEAFGEPAEKPSGALFAFRMPAEDAEQEVPFLREMLWLAPT